MRVKATLFALVSWSLCAGALCADDPSASSVGAAADQPSEPDTRAPPQRGNVELRRQDTDRGTEGQTSNTKLRFEAYPSGPLWMLRLDLPFPDDRSDFLGSPFNPHLGDIQMRAATRPIEAVGLPVSAFLELTFPTANPDTLGQGKYQVSVGMETSVSVASFSVGSAIHEISFAPLVQQVVSVAGDESRQDINYTRLELAVRDRWKNYTLSLTLKPVVDWEQDGATGAVTELESQMRFGRGWMVALMLGHRIWGGSIPSTYGTRVELTLGRRF
jgi:hypothetical protein